MHMGKGSCCQVNPRDGENGQLKIKGMSSQGRTMLGLTETLQPVMALEIMLYKGTLAGDTYDDPSVSASGISE